MLAWNLDYFLTVDTNLKSKVTVLYVDNVNVLDLYLISHAIGIKSTAKTASIKAL